MANIKNLTEIEAIERASQIEVRAYDIALDLAGAAGDNDEVPTFRSRAEVSFRCTRPGAETFIDVAAETIDSASLNGVALDTEGFAANVGLRLTGLAEDNVLVVDAHFKYSTSGQGMHRVKDTADGEVYLYTHHEPAYAHSVFACFDQPDLKARFTWHVTVPQYWHVVSNMAIDSVETGPTNLTKTVHFGTSVRMSTYVSAICAGPFHKVEAHHDGIDLALLCRRSMADHLDGEEIFDITRRGFDFYHDKFGLRYALAKYDQVCVPEFNSGAMENYGCVTLSEEHHLFRSKVTEFEYSQRANGILHELAHMWFGNLVTLRWWDDLWLNESFAEWISRWATAESTRHRAAWTSFLVLGKRMAYEQDQSPTTHPVCADAPDVQTAEVNFDGITYAKGASALKQLFAYVGETAFLAGLRRYLDSHAFANATCADFLGALEESSGRSLQSFAHQWLRTAQVNTLRPIVEVADDGTFSMVTVEQTAHQDFPTLRTHRLAIGLYDLDGPSLVRRDLVELDVTGRQTPVTELIGVRQPDLLLVNDDDLSYCKTRLDPRSLSTVRDYTAGLGSSLSRAVAWTATWDMLHDGEMPAREFVAQVVRALPEEDDVDVVTITGWQAAQAMSFYADPAWSHTGWSMLAANAKRCLRGAKPGSGLQMAWTRAYAWAARSPQDLAVMDEWLAGTDVPDGLVMDAGRRWQLIQSLVANGALEPDAIEAELKNDATDGGEREAAVARALIPTRQAKAAAWRQVTEDLTIPNWLQRAILQGFQHPAHVGLTASYVDSYFAQVADLWSRLGGERAHVFAIAAFPAHQVSQATVAAADQWLADPSHPAVLRRLVGERRDAMTRALVARRRDALER